MGSMISLALGRLEVDWGKNNFFTDHSRLFQPSDLKQIPYYYAGEDFPDGEPIVEFQEGFASPLRKVVQRLELMGYTVEHARRSYEELCRLSFDEEPPLSFDVLAEALAKVDVSQVSANYGEDYDPGKFVRREIIDRLSLTTEQDTTGLLVDYWEIGLVLENFGAYSALRLLAENPANLDLEVAWSFADVVDGGWVERDRFKPALSPSDRFLIVTEGSSDAKILSHVLALRFAQIADFFRFVDMEEGYPFSGTGNVFRFVQGLVSIGIENKTLVVFDNDAEGVSKFEQTSKLNLPHNLRAMRLPDDSDFQSFPTTGPNGDAIADINLKAASIECYLDLRFPPHIKPVVRWSSYNRISGTYQGELEQKSEFMKAFLDMKGENPRYDFTKLDGIINAIVAECVAIAEASETRAFDLPERS